MQHKTVAVATVDTDQQLGEFTAIAAAYSVDRVKDRIVPGAFANTIDRWRASGKRVPLHWDHKGEAHNVIGWIDPATMSETAEGLQVSGKLDIDSSDVAREAWRSMKNNAMSLSFGYITTKRRKRGDGVNELQELDLFEISIVPHPANPDTRIVEMKSIDHAAGDDMHTIITKVFAKAESASIETLEQKSERIAREHAPVQIASFEC